LKTVVLFFINLKNKYFLTCHVKKDKHIHIVLEETFSTITGKADIHSQTFHPIVTM
jgi:hypothetical protein